MSLARSARGDDGAYLVLYAVLAVVFFTIAALVLDITALRQDRKTSRFAADAAATAGAASLGSSVTAAATACIEAWGYFVANRPDAGGTVSAPDCALVFASACDPMAARTATGTTDSFHVEITNPVPDSHDLMKAEVQGGDQSQVADSAHDGTDPCKRIGVRVERTRDLSLAGVAGLRSASTDVHSVALSTSPTPTNQLVALVVLDPSGCNALTTVNEGKLTATATSGTGAIYVDSTGAGCGVTGGYIIHPDDKPQDEITADGGIYHLLGAFRPYDSGDVSVGRLTPEPVANATPVGRAAVDQRYGTVIASLEAAYGPLGTGIAALPVYPDPLAANESCLVDRNVLVTGDHYVNCPTLVVLNGGRLTFSSERLVIEGGIQVESGGCLAVNSTHCNASASPAGDGFVFVRSGNVDKAAGGRLALERTFVYLARGGSMFIDGANANSNDLLWRAPLAGGLEDLLFWSETPAPITIAGQKTFVMEGIFFAPGTAGIGEVRLVPIASMPPSVVQLIANRVVVDGVKGGNADFIVGPDPFRVVQPPTSSVRLIR